MAKEKTAQKAGQPHPLYGSNLSRRQALCLRYFNGLSELLKQHSVPDLGHRYSRQTLFCNMDQVIPQPAVRHLTKGGLGEGILCLGGSIDQKVAHAHNFETSLVMRRISINFVPLIKL